MRYQLPENNTHDTVELKQLARVLNKVLEPLFAEDMNFSEREPYITEAFEWTYAFLKRHGATSSLSNEVRDFEMELVDLVRAYVEVRARLHRLTFSIIRMKMLGDWASSSCKEG